MSTRTAVALVSAFAVPTGVLTAMMPALAWCWIATGAAASIAAIEWVGRRR